MKPFRTFEEVLRSLWAAIKPPRERSRTDWVLRSPKLEDSIYVDLRDGDGTLNQTEQAAKEHNQQLE